MPYTGNTIPRSTESTAANRRYAADFWKQSPEECDRRLDAMCALESQWLIDQKPDAEVPCGHPAQPDREECPWCP